MKRFPTTPEGFAEALESVRSTGERAVMHGDGVDVAALVPVEDAETLERLEDEDDAEVARRRLSDDEDKVLSLEEVRRELGLH